MNKKYEEPEIEVIRFTTEDMMIITSNETREGDSDDFDNGINSIFYTDD